MTPRLRLEGICKRFGGAVVLEDVSFAVEPAQVLGIIGPNGSGKTTLINVLNGVYRPTRGTVEFDGHGIEGLRPHRLISLGISRTFQNPRVFQSLTVLENLLMVTQGQRGRRVATASSRAEELLDFVGLTGFASTVASELSGGQKKLVEFARALMTQPRLVLMDEPFAGIHPQIKQELMDRIRRSRQDSDISYIIVSHEVPELVDLSDEFLCLAHGRVLASGSPTSVSNDASVIEAYLGTPLGAA